MSNDEIDCYTHIFLVLFGDLEGGVCVCISREAQYSTNQSHQNR